MDLPANTGNASSAEDTFESNNNMDLPANSGNGFPSEDTLEGNNNMDLDLPANSGNVSSSEDSPEGNNNNDHNLSDGSDGFDYCINRLKLRIQRLNAHLYNDNLIEVAVSVLNNMLDANLTATDIEEARIVRSWIGTDTDLLVEFRSEATRDTVYNLRTIENEGRFYVHEELNAQRVTVWRTLYRDFGEKKVYTELGDIILLYEDNTEVAFMTYEDLEIFYNEIHRPLVINYIQEQSSPLAA